MAVTHAHGAIDGLFDYVSALGAIYGILGGTVGNDDDPDGDD